LVTSRKPDDTPAFDREMIRVFADEREHSTEICKIIWLADDERLYY
jgi:hypothetical protein